MKRNILFIVFLILFALVIPGTSLFADFGVGGRFDAGLDLFVFPNSSTTEDDGMTVMPIIPLLDMGFYGQFNLGMLNLGAGIRGFSIIVINVFYPSVYAELNLWRFTLNAQIGGGALYLFPIVLAVGPYFVPELSMWYTLTPLNRNQGLRLGMGVLTLLSTQGLSKEQFNDYYIQNFNNNVIFYFAFKATFRSPWKTW